VADFIEEIGHPFVWLPILGAIGTSFPATRGKQLLSSLSAPPQGSFSFRYFHTDKVAM
jgi:hypothetical protein